MGKILSLEVLSAIAVEASSLSEAFNKAEMHGQLRVGAVQIEDEGGVKSSTLALGGSLGVKTASIKGVSLGATFYTTFILPMHYLVKTQRGCFWTQIVRVIAS